METPVSRVYNCCLENPENPKSAACKAAVDTAGTQQFYDWNGINRLDDHGRALPGAAMMLRARFLRG